MADPLAFDDNERRLIEGARQYCKNYAKKYAITPSRLTGLVFLGLVALVIAFAIISLMRGNNGFDARSSGELFAGLVGLAFFYLMWRAEWRAEKQEEQMARLIVKLAEARDRQSPPGAAGSEATGRA
jgi:hypothetical protein